MPLAPFVLTGAHVSLEPLSPAHADALAAAAQGDRATYGYTEVPDGVDKMAAYIDKLLAKARTGSDVPFAQRRLVDGGLGRLHALPGAALVAWPPRARRGRDRRHVARRRRPADPDQHRGQAAAAAPMPSRCGTSTGWPGPPTRATSAAAPAIERLGATFEGDPAPPPAVDGRRGDRPAAGHGAVRDDRRRLAGRQGGPARAARSEPPVIGRSWRRGRRRADRATCSSSAPTRALTATTAPSSPPPSRVSRAAGIRSRCSTSTRSASAPRCPGTSTAPTSASSRCSTRWRPSTPPSSSGPDARVRLPDVVERPAGDPEGLARAGPRARRRLPVRRAHGKVRPGMRPRAAHRRASARTARRGATSRLTTDGGRRTITRSLRLICGWRTRPTVVRAVRDGHRRPRRAGGVPRPRRARGWRRCEVARRLLPPRSRVAHRCGARPRRRRAHAPPATRCGSPTSTPRGSTRCVSADERGATSSRAPTRRSPRYADDLSGASGSCSSTRRGGAGSRRCSRAGSTGCGCATWRGTCPRAATGSAPACATSAAWSSSPRHGSSKLINALEGEAGKRTVMRTLRSLCTRRVRTRWIALYGVDTASASDRGRFLDRVTATVAR